MTVEFAGLWEANLVIHTALVQKATGDVVTVGARLGDEYPPLVAVPEQAGEAVALAVTVFAHLVIE